MGEKKEGGKKGKKEGGRYNGQDLSPTKKQSAQVVEIAEQWRVAAVIDSQTGVLSIEVQRVLYIYRQ